MKKVKIISLIIIILMILSCFSNFALIGSVNATDEGYNVDFGTVENGNVKVTVTFDKNLATDFNLSGWTKVDSKTIEATKAQAGYYAFTVNMEDGTQLIVRMITPFKLTKGEIIKVSESDIAQSFDTISITSSNPSVLKIDENNNITAVGKGTAKITVTATKDEQTGTLYCTGTVVETEDTGTDTLEWTDFSNCTFEWKENPNYLPNTLIIKNDKIINDHTYHVYIKSDDTLQNVNVNERNRINESYKKNNYFGTFYNESISISLNEFLELNNKSLYVTIIEEQYVSGTSTYKNKVVLKKQVNRPNELSLGKRMNAYFFSDYTSTYLWYPRTTDRKINLKIGRVTDKTILRNIMNKKSGCLQDLMEYAKKSEDTIYIGTVALGKSEEITSKMNLIDDAYYYVYMELEDEKGKYYPVEDISLYQALVSEIVGKNLFDYLSDDFKWNLTDEEEKKEDKTTAPEKLPQTGINQTVIIAIGVAIVILIGGYVGYRKYRGIK